MNRDPRPQDPRAEGRRLLMISLALAAMALFYAPRLFAERPPARGSGVTVAVWTPPLAQPAP